MPYTYLTDRPDRDERLARGYRPNPELELLIGLRARDPAAFAKAVTPALLISIGHYTLAKEAAERLKER